jgi:hypothetical protein
MTRAHLATIRALIRRAVASMLRAPAPTRIVVVLPRFVPHDAFGNPLALA